MSRRYVTLAPNASVWADEYNDEMERNLTVYERETKPKDTGLLDRHGVTLYAINDPEPIGFIHFKAEGRSSND